MMISTVYDNKQIGKILHREEEVGEEKERIMCLIAFCDSIKYI